MAANDTIADMLTRIRNANLARHQTVGIPATRMTRNIAQVLKDEGFITDFSETEGEDGLNWWLP
jgi:small subunit ribosomal protein S8